MGDAGADVEIEMRQQVGLVEQHQVGGGEHVGIFRRLVLALGGRKQHDLVRLAEIERGGADQIADILDEQQELSASVKRSSAWPTIWASRWQPLPVLTWIAVAPVARMRSASLEVCWSPSITAIGSRVLQIVDGAHQQRGLAGAGAGDEIQRQHALRREDARD